jgi:mitogen-activated protein kinase 15
LCDFGLCRSISSAKNDGKMMTDYVATRYYRPPEVLLCSSRYSEKIDIWSVACIMGEMFRSKPLLPGNSTMNQIERIVQLIGFPTDEDLTDIDSPFAEIMLWGVSMFERVSLSTLLRREETSDELQLMKEMLKFNATERYSAELALGHRYVSNFHNPRVERSFEGSIKVSCNENIDLNHTKKKINST